MSLPIIYVDHREHTFLIRELEKLGLSYELKSLEIGDILIQTKINGEEDTVCIERKTQQDFLNSFFDRRIFNQLLMMKQRYQFPVLIIEGEENMYRLRNVHPNAIRGMFTSLALDFQVPLLYSRNYRDTAKIVKNILDRLEKSKKPLTLYGTRKPLTLFEQQLYFVEALPGVGPTLARSLLREFKTIRALLQADEKMLQNVEKIGPKKAKALRDVFDIEFNEE